MAGEELLTTHEAAALLGLKQETVMRAVMNGKLGGRKLGRSWMVTPADVEDYKRAHLGRYGWATTRRTGKKGER